MCGISCIIKKEGTIAHSQIKAMNDIVAHRGPDGEGFYIDNNIALGHRRLAIIDLSTDGNQPMPYNDDLVLIFNGEIYNYIELRQQLIEKGHHFKTLSDTEVILVAYIEWGEQCVNYFNGMWSFCLYDKKKQKVFCSRDRFGVKPFYYSHKNDQFYIGSEIKQIIHFFDKKIANIERLTGFLIGSPGHQDETFFKDVHQLGQGHNLIYDIKTHTFEVKKFYTIAIKPEIGELPMEQAVDGFKNLFADAIQLRLRSDVQVGTALSGGLDSSSISALAAHTYRGQTKFKGIHARSSEKKGDESSFAQLVADTNNIDLHIITPKMEDFIRDIETLVKIQDEPFAGASMFMQYYVFQKAKELGCTVMLDGQGADEILLGYHFYYAYHVKNTPLPKLWKEITDIEKNSGFSKMKQLQLATYYGLPFLRKFNLKRKAKQLINHKFLNLVGDQPFDELCTDFSEMRDLQKNEILTTTLPLLLRYEDRNSMAHGIESRLPFMDYRLVEYALSANISHKIHQGWTKYLLRDAMNGILPNAITWRKDKIGFAAPQNSWLSQTKEHILKTISESHILNSVLNVSSLNDIDANTWKLYNIALWEKIYNITL